MLTHWIDSASPTTGSKTEPTRQRGSTSVDRRVVSLSCLRLPSFPTRNDTGVFVSDIVKGGLVDADGRLMQGDQILSVNAEDVRSATQEAVAALLKVHLPHSI